MEGGQDALANHPPRLGCLCTLRATVTMRSGCFGIRWQEFSFPNDARGSVVEHELGPCAPRTRLLMFTLRAFPLWQSPTHIFLRGYATHCNMLHQMARYMAFWATAGEYN